MPDFDELDLDIPHVGPDPFASTWSKASLVANVAIPMPLLRLGLEEAPPAATTATLLPTASSPLQVPAEHPVMISLAELHPPVLLAPGSPLKLPLAPIPEEPELEVEDAEPDLLCHEAPEEVMPQLLDDGKRRSIRLRANELPNRETVAAAAVRIKKRKHDAVTTSSLSRSSSTLTATAGDIDDTASMVTSATPATPSVAAPEPVAAPAWCVQDLQLLGRACGVPEDCLQNLGGCPAPVVDPLY
jgi:hypothetical protein